MTSGLESPMPVVVRAKPLVIQTLKRGDVADILQLGWRDFKAAPLYGLFFGGFYALGGMAIVSLFLVLHLPYVGYPLTMGFALIVPFVAAGTYEVSRRLERGEPLSWAAVLGAVWQRSGRELGWMALVTVFTLIIWVDFAIFLFLMFYGLHMPDVHQLFVEILSTQTGMGYIDRPWPWLFNFIGFYRAFCHAAGAGSRNVAFISPCNCGPIRLRSCLSPKYVEKSRAAYPFPE